jgi:hypothetical protein
MDATPLTGAFTAREDGFSVVLTLEQTPGGTVRGRLTGYGGTFDLHGLPDGSNLQGTLVDVESGRRLSFAGHPRDGGFFLSLFPLDAQGQLDFEAVQTLTLARSEGPPAEVPPPVESAPPAEAPPPGPTRRPAPPLERAASAEPEVVVNGQPLSGERLGALRPRLGPAMTSAGRYWYDAASGAWGVAGGPLAGFLAPSLDLPGPVPADASGGGTGRFANGRELHPQEVLALARCLGEAPAGRYWLDALGNLGLEGGPFLINLVDASPLAGGASGAAPAPENPLNRPGRAAAPVAAARAGQAGPGAFPKWTTLDDPFAFA